MGLRITAAAPAIASIAATALGIVLLASGSSTGTANNNYWIAVSQGDGLRALSLEPLEGHGRLTCSNPTA